MPGVDKISDYVSHITIQNVHKRILSVFSTKK